MYQKAASEALEDKDHDDITSSDHTDLDYLPATYPPSQSLLPFLPTLHSSDVKHAELQGRRYRYDTGRRSLILLQLGVTFVISTTFLSLGIFLSVGGGYFHEARGWMLHLGTANGLILRFVITGVATLCTEFTGSIHGIALRWALAKEGRLRFSTNLRLFTAAHGRWSLNGSLSNSIFALTLATAYASASGMFLSQDSGGQAFSILWALPCLILGGSILVQTILCLLACTSTHISTWSNNPLDVVPALIESGYVIPGSERCMRPAADCPLSTTDPIYPSLQQPSVWTTHPSVKKVVYVVWTLTCLAWICGFIMLGLYYTRGVVVDPLPQFGAFSHGWEAFLSFITATIFQGLLALGLHCSDLVVLLWKDEVLWRAASYSPKGASQGSNPFAAMIIGWPMGALLAMKPCLHWVFGSTVGFDALGKTMFYWLFIFAAVLTVISAFVTIVALIKPSGPQPSTYGHIQTLANVVDEWHPVMFWGHKSAGEVCHAGTSATVLPDVIYDKLYAGWGCCSPS